MSTALGPLPASACPGATQVLRAARELFAAHGFDGVSMQDIATRAGVSKATIFHHYANKEALHLAVLRDCVGTRSVSVEALIASPAPFEQRFLLLMQGEIADMLADEAATRLVVREVSHGDPLRAQDIARQIFSEDVKARIAFFADAKARGELREGVDAMLCDMLLGACCMFYFSCGRLCVHIAEALGQEPPRSAEAYARAVCGVLTHGMASPTALPKRRKPAVNSVVKTAARAVHAAARHPQPRPPRRKAKP
jgi:TetR/AcrR family transcriptional regulator